MENFVATPEIGCKLQPLILNALQLYAKELQKTSFTNPSKSASNGVKGKADAQVPSPIKRRCLGGSCFPSRRGKPQRSMMTSPNKRLARHPFEIQTSCAMFTIGAHFRVSKDLNKWCELFGCPSFKKLAREKAIPEELKALFLDGCFFYCTHRNWGACENNSLQINRINSIKN